MIKLTQALHEEILKQLENLELSEDIAYDIYMNSRYSDLADLIINNIKKRLSHQALEAFDTDKNLEFYYDDVFQKNLNKFENNVCYFQVDIDDLHIIVRFIPSDKMKSFCAFGVNKTIRELNTFIIDFAVKYLKEGISLQYIKYIISRKNYLIHEIAHLFLDKQTLGKATDMSKKDYDAYSKHTSYYYNSPSEYNSYYKQLLFELDKQNLDVMRQILTIKNVSDDKKFNTLKNILQSMVDPSVYRFLEYLNSHNQKKIVKKLTQYSEYRLDIKEAVFVDDIVNGDYNSTYNCTENTKYIKGTMADLKFLITDLILILGEKND